eukprot:1725986-Pyramimonas_sp.AAC.1
MREVGRTYKTQRLLRHHPLHERREGAVQNRLLIQQRVVVFASLPRLPRDRDRTEGGGKGGGDEEEEKEAEGEE